MRTLSSLMAGAGLALALVSSVQAQTPSALPVTPAKLALAQRVVTASGAQRMSAGLFKSMFDQMSTTMSGAGTPADKAFVADLLREETTKLTDRMYAGAGEIYAETFTDQELTDLLAFYQSPTGRSLISKQGEVAQRSIALILPLIPSMQRDILDKIYAHLCEQQTCTPEVRAKLTAAREKIARASPAPAPH